MTVNQSRSWLVAVSLVFVTAVVASTAIRIEWYNNAVGGFLPRPQPPSMEGNEVKWRATSADVAERSFRRSLAHERGLEITDDAIARIALSAQEQKEVEQIRRHAKLNAEFRALVGTMGLWQYPLVAVGLFLSWLVSRDRSKFSKPIGVICLCVNLVAFGLMLYREYYPSLGW